MWQIFISVSLSVKRGQVGLQLLLFGFSPRVPACPEDCGSPLLRGAELGHSPQVRSVPAAAAWHPSEQWELLLPVLSPALCATVTLLLFEQLPHSCPSSCSCSEILVTNTWQGLVLFQKVPPCCAFGLHYFICQNQPPPRCRHCSVQTLWVFPWLTRRNRNISEQNWWQM